MDIKYQFKENYLSTKHYKNAYIWALFAITAIVVISNLNWAKIPFMDLLLGDNKMIRAGQVWRVFTTSFLHADIGHLLSNSLMYFILTYYITSYFGAFFSYFIPIFVGGIINFITLNYYGPNSVLLGASGIVYYLWGVWISLYLLIQTQKSWWERGLRMGAVFLVLLVPTKYEPQTSYFAHYFGLLVGGLIGSFYFILRKEFFKSFIKYDIVYSTPVPIDVEHGEVDEDYPKYY
jgi:rhomboid protease GluP